MVGLLLLTLVTAQPQELTAPPVPEPVPMLEVMMKREGPRGGYGSAGDSGVEPFASYVTLTEASNSCGTGGYNELPSNFSGSAWRITGETLQRNGNTLTVRVTWQRVGENGRLVNREHPELSQKLTLKAGERFVLEPIAATSAQCGDARLEAEVVMRRYQPTIVGGGGGRVNLFSGAGGARAGSGGAGRVSSSELMRLRKEAQSASSAAPLSAVAGPPVDLELWLVDKRADGSEHAVRQLVRAGGENRGGFRFNAVVHDPLNGRTLVEITGEVRSVFGGRPNTLRVRLDRNVKADSNTRVVVGTSMVQFVLANASDVVAIELPERGLAGRGPLVPGHDFSLRVRLAPAK